MNTPSIARMMVAHHVVKPLYIFSQPLIVIAFAERGGVEIVSGIRSKTALFT